MECSPKRNHHLLTAIPQLPSGKLDLTENFFLNQLGFETHLKLLDQDFLIMRRDSAEIHFWQAATESEAKLIATSSSCYIRVRDIQTLFEELRARKAPFRYELTRKPWGMYEMQVDDPYGNAIKFGQRT